MTTLLPTQDLAMLRAIARTAAVLLVVVRIDQIYPGRAIADHEIADILEVDARTVKKQLRSLSAAGLVLEQRDANYVLTMAGRNTLFGWAERQMSLPQTMSLSIEEAQITSETQNPRTHCVLQDLDDDDDKVSIIDSISSSSINERTKCAKFLDATNLLFSGNPVNSDGLTGRDPEWVLAWIAKAYADRRNLTNPQGLVYSRLSKNVRPPVQFLKNAVGFLPENYLVEVGLLEKSEDVQDSEIPMVNSEYDGVGRHRGWLELLRSTELPDVRGCGFTGREPVLVDGNVMTITLRNASALEVAVENGFSEIFSKVYQEQTENINSRVVFVAVETVSQSTLEAI